MGRSGRAGANAHRRGERSSIRPWHADGHTDRSERHSDARVHRLNGDPGAHVDAGRCRYVDCRQDRCDGAAGANRDPNADDRRDLDGRPDADRRRRRRKRLIQQRGHRFGRTDHRRQRTRGAPAGMFRRPARRSNSAPTPGRAATRATRVGTAGRGSRSTARRASIRAPRSPSRSPPRPPATSRSRSRDSTTNRPGM